MQLIDLCDFCIDGEQIITSARATLQNCVNRMIETNELIRQPISFILLDLQMPHKSGIEVIEEIRRLYSKLNDTLQDGDKLNEPTFVITTNFKSKGYTKLLEEYGVTNVLSKPADYKTLQELIRE